MTSKTWHWEDLDFSSEVVAAARHGPKPATRLFVFILALVFLGAFFWADNATLDERTRGDGRVIPSSQMQVVQSLEGGIVKELLVHEGDLVEAGQVLIRIDDTSVASSLGELQVQRTHLNAVIARLTAEAQGDDGFTVPDALASENPQIVEQERQLYDDRRRELDNQIGILEQQVEQRRRELTDLQLQQSSVTERLGLLQQQLGIIWPLVQTGVVPMTEALQLREQVADLQGQQSQAENGIPRAEAAIAEAESRIEDARLSFRADARAELNQRRADLSVIEESIRAAQVRVVRTDIRSPVNGIVNTINVTTIGGVFQPGQHLMEIVPIEDSLLVEARVRPSDVAFLRPDLPAMVKISAYDFSIYGGLEGRIERISADTIQDETTGESFYRVIVRTDRNYLGTDEQPLPIIPGMVATVDILTGHKTVLQYLLKPLLRGHAEALHER